VNLTGIDLDTNLDDLLGFIYLIELDNGGYYVGRKQFWSKRGRSWVDSGWRDYIGSSKELLRDVESGAACITKRSILSAFTSKSAIRFAEAVAIILSGSYLDRDNGYNWSFEGCRGFIKYTGRDEEQMINLFNFFLGGNYENCCYTGYSGKAKPKRTAS
jgi:hypothetical protein